MVKRWMASGPAGDGEELPEDHGLSGSLTLDAILNGSKSYYATSRRETDLASTAAINFNEARATFYYAV